MTTVLLLFASNIFMTAAWYGHLRFRNTPLWMVILGAWGIAFFEYCFQVPANRWGYGRFTAGQPDRGSDLVGAGQLLRPAAFRMRSVISRG